MNACGFIFASQGFTVHSERTGMDRKPLVVEDVNYYTRIREKHMVSSEWKYDKSN